MAVTKYLIALGSNQRHHIFGRPSEILGKALHRLNQYGLSVTNSSSIVTSLPIGPSSRNYANSAAIVDSNLKPTKLLYALKNIEAEFGLRRGQKWSKRVLDLDIILSSDGMFWSRAPALTIPHPAMHQRDFVLQPAAEIAPDWRDPISGLTIRHLVWRLKRAKPLDPKHKRH